ncbi:MAG: thioredoxin family protein [Candidatus Thorarchaeota archaeon]
MPTLSDIDHNAPSCTEYIERMSPVYRGGYTRFAQDYVLKTEAVKKLEECVRDYTIVVLFADWCGDARRVVPVLSLLEKRLGIKVIALGGMTKPPYGSTELWQVPPSPREVNIFGVTASPTIIVFDKSGEEVGRMRTRPRMAKTVEEEILKIIESGGH